VDDFGPGSHRSASCATSRSTSSRSTGHSSGVGTDAKDAAITANVVSLAHALGLLAIAEGIESDEQLLSMRKLGCDLAQGYAFARPAPAAEIEGLLAGGQPLTEAA
jgi:EAL domain-containing protein (putative c-di-GMP-specific phosphodiesterase class I)